MKRYYDRRAAEYDATSFEALDVAGRADLGRLEALLASLQPGRVLDVACGTGYLTRRLRGEVVALDQSPRMLELARARLPRARVVRADVPPLPFADAAFDRVVTSNFYGHLAAPRLRARLVHEALRVAPELIVVEQAWRPGLPGATWERRQLRDGSAHRVFKRYFTPAALAAELGGDVLLATGTFIVARTARATPGATRPPAPHRRRSAGSPASAPPPRPRPG